MFDTSMVFSFCLMTALNINNVGLCDIHLLSCIK